MSAPPLLEVSSLRKRFGAVQAVDGLSFSVGAGECFGLLGPNGAGKTTTISIISTLLGADEGSVTVGGRDAARHAEDVRRTIGLVPQELSLYEELTATENLSFFGKLQGLTGPGLRERVSASLALARLEDR